MTHLPYYQPGHPSLNQVISLLGYSTEPSKFGAKHIIKDGTVAHSGQAYSVWEWLRASGQWKVEQVQSPMKFSPTLLQRFSM